MVAVRVGILLSGCGAFDGSDINEAVLTLLALDRAGAEVTWAAPDMDQHHVLDQATQEELEGRRNILQESARIAKGAIVALADLDADQLDALVLPGGFGAIKHFCDFAFKGPTQWIDPQVRRILTALRSHQKPIAAMGMAVVPLVIALSDDGPEIAVGEDGGIAAAVEKMGGRHHICRPGEIWVDNPHKLVTMPMFEPGTGIATIADSIAQLVKKVLGLMEE